MNFRSLLIRIFLLCTHIVGNKPLIAMVVPQRISTHKQFIQKRFSLLHAPMNWIEFDYDIRRIQNHTLTTTIKRTWLFITRFFYKKIFYNPVRISRLRFGLDILSISRNINSCWDIFDCSKRKFTHVECHIEGNCA